MMLKIGLVKWVFAGLLSALMVLSAIPDLLRDPGAVSVFHHLGYPEYLLPFLGTAKLLGVVAVLAPGTLRIKEWAFAGISFDLSGALYSHLSVGDPPQVWMPALIGILLLAATYAGFRRASARRRIADPA
jgi:hypothetical protein